MRIKLHLKETVFYLFTFFYQCYYTNMMGYAHLIYSFCCCCCCSLTVLHLSLSLYHIIWGSHDPQPPSTPQSQYLRFFTTLVVMEMSGEV